MKVMAIGMGLAAVAFLAMGLQMGLLPTGRFRGVDAATTEQPDFAPGKGKSKFPEDLAPAARAEPVRAAAEYKFGPTPHPMVFLKLNGELYASWMEGMREEWQAESVASTELVVVVGTPKRIFVNRIDYPGGAPPITRYIFELEISVIEAKTGRILANRLFRNLPRNIQQMEEWRTTAIGRAVSMQQVFAWVSATSKTGFPSAHDPAPITLQVD
jgi:hypothetical protein